MDRTDRRIDVFLRKATRWREEMAALRSVALDCGLTETFKWRQPCYTHEDENVLILSAFREYCALAFFRGALLEDRKGRLSAPGPNSQAARQMRFTSLDEIRAEEEAIRSFIRAAVALHEAGARVDFAAKRALELPKELSEALGADRDLTARWEALTPGRQRSHVLHIGAAKKPETRVARCRAAILEGRGWGER